jgi:integrase
MGKRSAGEGSIYRRKSDGKWVGAIHLGYADGKRRRKIVYGRTQGEVRDKLQQLRADHAAAPVPVGPPESLDAFLNRWLLAIEYNVAPTTLSSYESLLRVHVRPTLGRRRLDQLQPVEIQELLAARQRAGSSPRTVQYVHAVLRKALADAESWGLLARNPAKAVRPPRVTRPDARPLSRDEMRRLLEAAEHERLGPLFVVALCSGLRLGELLGLQWTDLEPSTGTLRVRRTRRRDGSLADPKSAAGRREVELPREVVDGLLRWRLTSTPSTEGWMFTTREGGPLQPRHVQRVWERLLRAAEIAPRGFHQLRKTFASLLVEHGVDVRTAQLLLGHADVRMTLEVYTRTSSLARSHAAERIGALLAAPTE